MVACSSMTLTGSQLLNVDEPRWFCLKTQPKREHIAAAALRQLTSIDVFSPRIRFRKATRRGPVWFAEAMFPGYVFAHFVYRNAHRHVQSFPGISKIVSFGDRVGVLSPETVASLRVGIGKEETIVFAPALQIGNRIKIAEGPFLGLEAVITQLLPARERVKVLLEFLGRPVEAEVGCPKILSSASPRGTHAA